jgi:hypothetical protein
MRRRKQNLWFWVCVAISLLASFGLAWCTAVEYAATAVPAGSNPEYDLGDAPDGSGSPGGLLMQAYPDRTAACYPTVYEPHSLRCGPIHRQPGAVAYLGPSVTRESAAAEGADEDSTNNLRPWEPASNRDGGDDGLGLPLTLPSHQPTTLAYTVTVVNPSQGIMYANVWFDWNRDGDWDDTLTCPDSAQAPEWAVQNQAVVLTTAGPLRLVTPAFVCWHPEAGAPAPIWMRITLSETPSVAIGQSRGSGGSGPAGGYLYGETEDYYLSPEQSAAGAAYAWREESTDLPAEGKLRAQAADSPTDPVWIQALADPLWKWSQEPDTTANAIGIRVDSSDLQKRILADDFECKSTNCIVGVRLWGAWKNDQKGQITRIRLSIYDNDPAGQAGADAANLFSQPAPDSRWQKEFGPGQLTETLYFTQTVGQWAWDPAKAQLTVPGSTQLWQITVNIPTEEAFQQQGSLGSPRIYWLGVDVQTAGGEFGWQTRRSSGHSLGAAVWAVQTSTARLWQELRYPAWHPAGLSAQTAVDLAFNLMYADCAAAPTSQPSSSTQCPAVATRCPEDYTTCPELWTNCPAESTKCPERDTECPTQSTRCPPATVLPAVATQCPAVATSCPPTSTRCPEEYTTCPESYTGCPAASTRCPETNTTCPPKTTECPTQSTSCPPCTVYPPVSTQCPAVSTTCPATPTVCQGGYTQCPQSPTQCPQSATQCPAKPTECPTQTTQCPVVNTVCPTQNTQCPVVVTTCPTAPTLCPIQSTQCPEDSTKCPPKATECPVTSCPAEPTKCKAVETQCPLTNTKCFPPTSCIQIVSVCPMAITICPATATKCPVVDTQCPTASTRCPPEHSRCPFGIYTVCPSIPTRCPPTTTYCPTESTKCPATPTECTGWVNTVCPARFTFCPRCPLPAAPSGTSLQTSQSRPQAQLLAARAVPVEGAQNDLILDKSSAPALTLPGSSAVRTFLRDALGGGCPTVETKTAPALGAGG